MRGGGLGLTPSIILPIIKTRKEQANRRREVGRRPAGPSPSTSTTPDSTPYHTWYGVQRCTRLQPKHSVFRACADAMPSATTKSHQCDPRQERSCTVPAHWRELLKYQVPSTCYKYSVLRAPCLWALAPCQAMLSNGSIAQLLNCSSGPSVHPEFSVQSWMAQAPRLCCQSLVMPTLRVSYSLLDSLFCPLPPKGPKVESGLGASAC